MKQFLRHLIVPTLILVLVPLFATWVLSYTFQDGVIHAAPFGIIDQDNSQLSRTLVRNIAENDIFDVQYYGQTADDLKAQIEQNNVVAGIIIPKDFSKDVSAGNSPSVLIVYDGCQMSVVGISKVKIAEVLTTLKVAASVQVLEGKLDLPQNEALLYAQPISNTFRYLGNPEKSIRNYVLPGAIANVAQLTMYMFVVEAIRKRVEERVHPLIYSLAGAALSTATLMGCIWMMVTVFGFPMHGSWTTVLLLTFFNMWGIGNLAAMVRILLPEKMKTLVVECAVIVMAMLLFSGYTFPTLGMPYIFQVIARWIPFTYFAIPLRDVMLLGSGTALVLADIRWLFLFSVGSAILTAVLWFGYRQKILHHQAKAKAANENSLPAEQEVTASC